MALLALLTTVALVGAACGGDDEPPAGGGGGGGGNTDCTWAIGTMGALSGDAATIGQPIFKGIEYGVDQVNQDGTLPCKLELVSQDSQGDPSQAPPLAQEIAQTENLIAVVGPYFSGETDAVGDTFEEAGLPFLTPSATNPDLSGNGWNGFFRLVGTDAQQGSEAADYITRVAGKSKVAVMHDNSEYGKPLAEVVKDTLGSAGTTIIPINPEETDHSAEISKVPGDVDAVFFGGYQPEFSELLKQASDAGIGSPDVLWLSGDGSKAPELGGDDSAQGAIAFCPCDDPAVSTNPDANAFAKNFKADVGEPPGTYAVEGFDGVQMVANAIVESGLGADASATDVRAAIVEYIHSNPYTGLSKTYEFDDKGEIGTVSIFAYQVAGSGDSTFKQLGLVSEL
jgi:branched-chain amino acid transport system substrate-binding protein